MKCLVCREDIQEGAKKCIHCDSYQDWRRYFSVGTVVLSLLIALFSVLTTLIPVVLDAFHTPRAKLEFKVLECKVDGVRVRVRNTGDQLTAVSGGEVRLHRGGGAVEPGWALKPAGGAKTIFPGKQSEFRLALDSSDGLLPRARGDGDECRYQVELIEESLLGEASGRLIDFCECPR
jgi:hypothetical protein